MHRWPVLSERMAPIPTIRCPTFDSGRGSHAAECSNDQVALWIYSLEVLQRFWREISETAPWTSRLIMPYESLEKKERACKFIRSILSSTR